MEDNLRKGFYLTKWHDIGEKPSVLRDPPWVWTMSRLTRDGRPNLSREIKFSGANGEREIKMPPILSICSLHTNRPIVGVGKERRTVIGPW